MERIYAIPVHGHMKEDAPQNVKRCFSVPIIGYGKRGISMNEWQVLLMLMGFGVGLILGQVVFGPLIAKYILRWK